MFKDPISLSVMAASKLHPTAVPSDWVCLHVKVLDYCSLHNKVWGIEEWQQKYCFVGTDNILI